MCHSFHKTCSLYQWESDLMMCTAFYQAFSAEMQYSCEMLALIKRDISTTLKYMYYITQCCNTIIQIASIECIFWRFFWVTGDVKQVLQQSLRDGQVEGLSTTIGSLSDSCLFRTNEKMPVQSVSVHGGIRFTMPCPLQRFEVERQQCLFKGARIGSESGNEIDWNAGADSYLVAVRAGFLRAPLLNYF